MNLSEWDFKSHLLRILHNNVRLPKIHVSVTGKISLIDFGVIDYTNNENREKNDSEALDHILGFIILVTIVKITFKSMIATKMRKQTQLENMVILIFWRSGFWWDEHRITQYIKRKEYVTWIIFIDNILWASRMYQVIPLNILQYFIEKNYKY